jgi:hypothetical protein
LMLVGSVAQGVAQTAATTLQAAAARGLVEYQFEGTGASSGDSVRVKVKRNPRAPDPFPITIPPGTILRSGGAAQSMAVSVVRGIDVGGGFFEPTSRIVLQGSAWVTAILSAFCAEFEKDNPSATTPFTLEQPDPTMACLLNRTRNLSVATQQAAVWMYTDRLTYRQMSEKFQVSGAEWAAAEKVFRACTGGAARIPSDGTPLAITPRETPAPSGDVLRRFFETPQPTDAFGRSEDAIRSGIEQVRRGRYSNVPILSTGRVSGLNGTASLTIENASRYPLRVLLSGARSSELRVSAGDTLSTTLPPGNYEIAVTASGGSLLPFYGQYAFRPDTANSLRLFVAARLAGRSTRDVSPSTE